MGRVMYHASRKSEMHTKLSARKPVGPLSSQHGVSWDCGCRRLSPEMEGSCEYTE
jgi:hypothetical protein